MDNAIVQTAQDDTQQDQQDIKVEKKEEQDQATPEPTKEKKPHVITSFINSPWIFLMVPVLAGAIWLVNNTWVVTNNLDKPYALALAPTALLSLIAIKLVLNFFSVIEKWIRLQFEKAKQAKRSQFLEFVIAVFMFVSVCEAGPFFNEVQGNILAGALGYITVFAFDLVAVVCMRGRAKMLRKGHDKKAFVYQTGVWICAVVSIIANFYSSFHNVQQAVAHNADLGGWMGALAPVVGVVFPVMIIFLSYATDADDDIDDPVAFKEEQQKKVEFAQAKYEIASSLLAEKVKMDLLKQREFFLKNWFFTKKKINFVIETVKTEVLAVIDKEQLLEDVKQSYSPQIESLQRDLNRANARVLEQEKALVSLHEIIDDLQASMQSYQEQLQDVKDECIGTVYDALKSEASMQNTPADTMSFNAEKAPAEEERKTQKASASSQGNGENKAESNEDTQWVLSHYPIVAQWHAAGVPSVTIEQIKSGTGHTPQKVHRHLNKGAFQKTKRNGYYRVASVIEWLKKEPLPKTEGNVKETNNTDAIETVIVPETPASMEPNTGEFEAIKDTSSNGHSSEYNLDELEEMTA
jgi:Txe/YoeB family toxin of Txe-Axe toxin-antitoxin module